MSGLGEVLTSYYMKERLLQDMEEAKTKQMQFDNICSQLKDLDERHRYSAAKGTNGTDRRRRAQEISVGLE